jgi:cytochrome c oxidase cbb3-type subunit I/II
MGRQPVKSDCKKNLSEAADVKDQMTKEKTAKGSAYIPLNKEKL